ncbi:MAG: DUF421 domain-containing protein [Sarcina sp.]
MIITFIRTIILYFTVILVIRLMGKRQLGELQPYELVVTIMISDLASLPMQDSRLPLLLGIIPIVTLLVLKTFLLELQIRIPFLSDIIGGSPVIIIDNSKLQTKNLKRQRMSIDDLFEEIREQGYFDLSQIKYAILENNGSISIFPKEEFEAVSKGDLNISTTPTCIPKILYVDGRFIKKSLNELKKDSLWIEKELKKIQAPPLNDIFLITINCENKLAYETY